MSDLKNDTLIPAPNEQAQRIAALLVQVGLRLTEKIAAEPKRRELDCLGGQQGPGSIADTACSLAL